MSSCSDLSLFEKERPPEVYIVNDFPGKRYEDGDNFRIFNWNIQLGFANDLGAYDGESIGATITHLNNLANEIKKYDPDLILLQEVGHDLTNTIVKDQTQFLAQILEMNYSYGDYGELNTGKDPFFTGQRRHVVLSKSTITAAKAIDILYKTRYDQRRVLETEIQLNDEEYWQVVSVHLASRASPEEKLYQIARLCDLTNFQRTSIFAGDYNQANPDRFIDTLKQCGVVNPLDSLDSACTTKLKTYGTTGVSETAFMGVLIDHFFTNQVGIEFSELCLGDESSWELSDHKPIILDVVLN